jgi:probable phosphoglycerate mutase
MTVVLLIRHAEACVAANTILGRMPGVRLSTAGREQIETLARQLQKLPIRAIYHSPLERAQETAEEIARHLCMKAVPTNAFNELDYGSWTERTYAELGDDPEWYRFNNARSLARIPDGESILDVEARTMAEMDRFHRCHPDQLIAVVTHADVIRTVLARSLGLALDLAARMEISTASLSVVKMEHEQYRVLMINGHDVQRLV